MEVLLGIAAVLFSLSTLFFSVGSLVLINRLLPRNKSLEEQAQILMIEAYTENLN